MKTSQQFRLLMLLSTVGVAVLAGSCGDNAGKRVEDRADTIASRMEEGTNNASDRASNTMNRDEDADKEFLEDAVELNTEELRALMVGQQKGGAQVKKHMSHMISDHKKLGSDVKTYLSKKNLTLADVDTADTHMPLADDKPGADWDKNFADLLVRDHEKAVSRFEDGQKNVKDPDLKAVIDKALPTLRSHLDMARDMQAAVNRNR